MPRAGIVVAVLLAMRSLKLDLDLVSPLFLGGADPNESEWRAAPLRGALRYWFRALVGLVDLAAMARQESAVFGSPGFGSPVTIRLSGSPRRMAGFDLDRNRNPNLARTGHDYLYYSTRLGTNNRTPLEPGVASGALSLQARDEAALVSAGAAAWLLTHLGGIGGRSRRCAGSIQVAEAEAGGLALPGFPVLAESATELVENLKDGIAALRRVIPSPGSPSDAYDVLHPSCCTIWVAAGDPPWRDWKAAVEAAGSRMQSFRAAARWNKNRTNAIFGLPIRHDPDPRPVRRRASPLWLRVTRLATGEHVVVATLFKARFLERDPTVGGGYAHIEDFLSSHLGGQQVIYV